MTSEARNGDNLHCLVRRSMAEDRENRRKARHNCTADVSDIRPYSNSALCDLVDAVDHILTPNAEHENPRERKP